MKQKIWIALGIVEYAGGVVFTYYLAQEIPWIYTIAIIGIIYIIPNWKKFEFNRKHESSILIPAAVLFTGLFVSIVAFS